MENETQQDIIYNHSPWITIQNVPIDQREKKNDSLREWDLENETNNFGRLSLGCTATHQMMKCDRQGEIIITLYEMNIIYV